jgi:site-specific DNA recombinase
MPRRTRQPLNPRRGKRALAAIGKSRLWLEEILAGSTFAEIAKREGKGERQIRLLLPLAFVPPATVCGLINGTATAAGVTEMARNVPLVWA